MDKTEVLKKVAEFKRLVQNHFNLDSVYLFGSYARETEREDSDIDVALIVNKDPGDFFTVNPLLWRLSRQIDDRIEPILIDKNNDPAGFLADIKAYGIEV